MILLMVVTVVTFSTIKAVQTLSIYHKAMKNLRLGNVISAQQNHLKKKQELEFDTYVNLKQLIAYHWRRTCLTTIVPTLQHNVRFVIKDLNNKTASECT